MQVPELAEPPAPSRAGHSPLAGRRSPGRSWAPAAAVLALTLVGLGFRIILAHQSVFADELSTYWISVDHGLGGVLSLLYGTGRIHYAEISPPLSFLASWLTTRAGHSPELLRLPALIAGTATIPLVYALGRRAVGRRAALLATALTALSPFMIYYSAEARAYGLMMFFTVSSTLAMLLALETRRRRWWMLYAVASCAAFYTHYTCVFVLAAQLLWLLWSHREARRAALIANLAAAAGVLPWLPGLINNVRSPTEKILSALSPFTPGAVRQDLEHWAVGYPYTLAGGLRALPGLLALVLLAVAVLITVAGLVLLVRRRPPLRDRLDAIDRRVWLMILLAVAVPVGEAVVSATGNHIFGVRNLAASWPYLALACSAAVAALEPRLAFAAAALAIVAFALGATKELTSRFERPDYQAAANFVAANARPGDVVVDETGALSPGPLTGLDVTLHRRLPIYRAEAPAERDHPYGFGDPIVPLQTAITHAVAAANGHRVFLVTNRFDTNIAPLAGRVQPGQGQFPATYRLVESHRYSGFGTTVAAVYAYLGPR
jgi:hypothetical protein